MSTQFRKRPQRSSEPPPTGKPLINPTGSVKLDVVADVLNRTADVWTTTPPAEQGMAGVIAAGIVAGLQTFGAPFELLDMGFAAVTSDIAAMIPAQPAATISSDTLGATIPHAHAHPPTFGVPLPGLGPLTCGGAQTVTINGKPAARAGDLGLAPTCGGFAPAFEIFTGSSNVFIGGSRAARRTDVIRQCDPTLGLGALGKAMGAAGVVAEVAQAGAELTADNAAAAALAAQQATADAIALAVSATLGKDPGVPPGIGAIVNGSPNVEIGGFPTPDILDMFGGLAKLARLGKKALRKNAGHGPPPKRPNARADEQICDQPGHPVDTATGAVFDEAEDFIDPVAGFRWARWYRSTWHDEPRALGPGWRHVFDKRLAFTPARCVLHDYDGTEVDFPCIDRKAEAYGGTTAGYTLTQTGSHTFEVWYGDDRRLEFECVVPHLRWSEARLTRWSEGRLDLRLRYDKYGRLRRIFERDDGEIDPSREVVFEHDEGGRIIEVSRGPTAGRKSPISGYGYDDRGCLVWHRDAAGHVSRCEYDRNRLLTRLLNRNGYSFHWAYDALGRCIETHGDDGLYRCTFEYEPGRTFVRKADGGEWAYTFNRWGTTLAIVDPYGGTKRYELDENSRIVAQYTPDGRRTRWLYDESGRHIGRVDPFGFPLPPENDAPNARPRREAEPPATPRGWHVGESVAALGSAPRLRVPPSLQPRLNRVWAGSVPATATAPPPRRNQLGRVVARFDADGSAERFEYDAEGNPIRHVDRDGREFQLAYTSWNLRTTLRDPEGRLTQVKYDADKNRVAFTDPGGHVTEYPRDLRGRIDRVIRDGRVRERYEYGIGDQLVAKRGGDERLLCRYKIGSNGRHSKKSLASGEVITYEYDRRGRICAATTKSRSIGSAKVERQHDAAGAVLSDTRDGKGVRHRSGTDGSRATVVLARFVVQAHRAGPGEWTVRTPDGSVHAFQRDDQGFVLAELGNGTRELSCFDFRHRCAGKLRWRADGDDRDAERWVRYAWSPEGELRSVEDAERGTTRYEYDRAHRLVGEVSDAGVDERWEYDRAGNLITLPDRGWATYGSGNRLCTVGDSEAATYDDRDNLVEIRRGEVWTRFIYDSLDNLVAVTWSDRPEVWAAAYDGLGRRIWKDYGGRRTEYFWDDDRLAAEVDPDGRLRVYAYPSADAFVPFMFLDYDSVESSPDDGRAYYIFTNQIGAPLRIEDAAGRIAWEAVRYRAYGELELAAGATIDCNLRWPGHLYDPETGLQSNRYRYYSPKLGRYIQTDPLGVGGGLNTHAAPPNPVATVDLLGLAYPCDEKTKPETGPDGAKTKPEIESDDLADRYDRAMLAQHHEAVDAHEARYRQLKVAALEAGNDRAARGHQGKVTEARGERSAAHHMESESGPGGRYEHCRMERGFAEGSGFDQLWVRRKPPNDPNGEIEEIVVVEAKGRNETTGRPAELGDSDKGPQMSERWVRRTAMEMARSGTPEEKALAREILRGMRNGPPPKVIGRVVTAEDPREASVRGRPRKGLEDRPPSTAESDDYTKRTPDRDTKEEG